MRRATLVVLALPALAAAAGAVLVAVGGAITPATGTPAATTAGQAVATASATAGASRPAPAATSPPDLNALIREAQRVQRADTMAWARYRFRRGVHSERLEEDGSVRESTTLEFEVRPAGGDAFDERLLRIDGRPPTPQEVEEHRGEARFTRHYRTLSAGRDEHDVESGYSLATLLRLSSYRYAGREEVGGVAAHRLDFEPDPDAGGQGIAARITQAMSGSLWISVEGLHLVRATAATRRPVMLFLGLSRVRSIEVELEATEVAPGIVLPGRVTMVTHARVFFSSLHRRQVFTYFDYRAP